MLWRELTYEVIGAAMEVHKTIGCGYQERIYQRALSLELGKRGLPFEQEYELPVEYDDYLLGVRRVDFFIDDRLMVEIKAVREMDNHHIHQIMNYCEMFKLPLGLLINFGSTSLEFRRIYNRSYNGSTSKGS